MIKLNNLNLKPAKVKGKELSISTEKNLVQILKKMHERAELEIFDTSYYRTINEHLVNKDNQLCCKAIAFNISKDMDNKAKHKLEILMLHPTMNIEINRPLVYGSKEDILKFLADKNSVKQIMNDISQMSEKLMER